MKNVILILAFLAAFFAVQYGMNFHRDYSTAYRINAEIEAMEKLAKRNNPNEPEVIAMQKVALKKIDENINSESSQDERLINAATAFMGFYLMNYRQRAEYCLSQRIDISPFINAFKESHKNEYAKAEKVLAANRSDFDKVFNMDKPRLVNVIEQDMEYIASENDLSLSEACQLVSETAQSLVLEMHISVVQPNVYAALMLDL